MSCKHADEYKTSRIGCFLCIEGRLEGRIEELEETLTTVERARDEALIKLGHLVGCNPDANPVLLLKAEVAEGEKRQRVATRFIKAMTERDNVTGRCSCWNLGSTKPCGVCVAGREVAEASNAYHATGTPKVER